MINTKDMARAIDWAINRPASNGGKFLAVNSGSNDWNTTMLSLAEATAEVIPGVNITINPDAPPDKRSYRANFDLFKQLAPNHQPVEDLNSTITEIKDNLIEMNFNDANYRESQLMRLHVINRLQKNGKLNNQLQWIR